MQAFFHKKDYADEKYLRKKSFYLLCLAKELVNMSEIIDNESLEFSCCNHSYYSHALVVKPSGTLGKKCKFYLRVVPENNIYSLNKFSLNSSNIDSQWYFNNSTENGKILW